MAFFSGTAPRSHRSDLAISLRAALRQTLDRRRSISQVRRELSRLSDRDLSDIGINRADIDAIARRTADAA